MDKVIAVLALGALCASWVIVQRWIAKHDPGQPGVNGKCHSCGPKDAGRSVADSRAPGNTAASSDESRFSV